MNTRPISVKGSGKTHKVSFGLLLGLVLPLLFLSFIPMVDTYRWWVRLADFPRLQIAIALLVLAVPVALFLRRFRKMASITLALMAAAILYHGYVLLPYAPAGPEFPADSCPSGSVLSIMVANVKMHNDPNGKLVETVRKVEPDILLAMETNAKWDRALAPLTDTMPHTVEHISGSQYGMHLFSRLALESPEVRFLADQGTPQIVTGVTLRNGEVIDFLGVHPRPPLPSESALGRDAVLYRAAFILRDQARPGVVAGDFNATPWESATARMREIGRLQDPRRSYGYVPTFDARSWWMSWPLDQVFHEAGFATLSLERLDYFGSDHYPFMARFCRTDGGVGEPPSVPEPEDIRQAQQVIEQAIEQRNGRAASKQGGA
jgi:endonuclease/exonuclease/phosphatase (EEP) superfamily protein YafD